MLYALNSDTDGSSQVLWEDGERVFCRGWRIGNDGNRSAVLVVLPAAEHPSRSSLDRLAHEYALRDELDGKWAAQPLDLTSDGARPALVKLADSRGNADGEAQEASHLHGCAEQPIERLAPRILEHQHDPTGVAHEAQRPHRPRPVELIF